MYCKRVKLESKIYDDKRDWSNLLQFSFTGRIHPGETEVYMWLFQKNYTSRCFGLCEQKRYISDARNALQLIRTRLKWYMSRAYLATSFWQIFRLNSEAER